MRVSSFPIRLRELRLEKELYQRELGKVLGVKENTVSAWEKSRNQPDYDMLMDIADFFDVTVDYLIGRTDEFDRKL